MNKFSTIILLMLFMLGVLLGCTSDVIDTPEYEGKHLVIGVIGEPPEIREENVSFKKMTFSQLVELQSPSDFDAVFITKENLPEAADQKYAKIYKTSGIPFFFIESKKSYLPFTLEEMSYDEVPNISDTLNSDLDLFLSKVSERTLSGALMIHINNFVQNSEFADYKVDLER